MAWLGLAWLEALNIKPSLMLRCCAVLRLVAKIKEDWRRLAKRCGGERLTLDTKNNAPKMKGTISEKALIIVSK